MGWRGVRDGGFETVADAFGLVRLCFGYRMVSILVNSTDVSFYSGQFGVLFFLFCLNGFPFLGRVDCSGFRRI